jgi:hypothetical protein
MHFVFPHMELMLIEYFEISLLRVRYALGIDEVRRLRIEERSLSLYAKKPPC